MSYNEGDRERRSRPLKTREEINLELLKKIQKNGAIIMEDVNTAYVAGGLAGASSVLFARDIRNVPSLRESVGIISYNGHNIYIDRSKNPKKDPTTIAGIAAKKEQINNKVANTPQRSPKREGFWKLHQKNNGQS